MRFCSYVIFLLLDQWLIERLSKALLLGAALVDSNFSPTPLGHRKFHFIWKKKWLSAALNVQSIKNFLTLELSCFPQASLSRSAATAADLKTPCVCACQSYPRKQSRRAAPRAWPLILPSKPSITFWNSLWRDCQMTGRGSNLDSNLNSATWPTSCKGL